MSFSSDFVAYRLSSTSHSHQILFIRVLEHVLRMKNCVLKVSHTAKHYYISGLIYNAFQIKQNTTTSTLILLCTCKNSVTNVNFVFHNIDIKEIKSLWHPFKYTIVVVFFLRNCVTPTNNCISIFTSTQDVSICSEFDKVTLSNFPLILILNLIYCHHHIEICIYSLQVIDKD